MVSKTKIEKRLQQKTNPEIVRTLIKLKKTNPEIAKLLVRPVKKLSRINLDKISKIGKNVLVVGKVLSSGNLEKGVKVVAWGFSERAKEKIKEKKGTPVLIVDEIKTNPELKSLEVLR